jgi:hypothetical protein
VLVRKRHTREGGYPLKRQGGFPPQAFAGAGSARERRRERHARVDGHPLEQRGGFPPGWERRDT